MLHPDERAQPAGQDGGPRLPWPDGLHGRRRDGHNSHNSHNSHDGHAADRRDSLRVDRRRQHRGALRDAAAGDGGTEARNGRRVTDSGSQSATTAAPTATASATAATPASERERVLIVDDDAVSAQIVMAMVGRLGFDVDHVGDGIEAVAACQRFTPVFVLMDLDMPRLDGLQATRRIRASQRQGAVAPCRIVICSGTTRVDAPHLSALAGADAFLSKPLSLDGLRAQLRHSGCAAA